MGHSKFETDQQITIILFGKKIDFYVIEDSFPIIEDGIIGATVLKRIQIRTFKRQVKTRR